MERKARGCRCVKISSLGLHLRRQAPSRVVRDQHYTSRFRASRKRWMSQSLDALWFLNDRVQYLAMKDPFPQVGGRKMTIIIICMCNGDCLHINLRGESLQNCVLTSHTISEGMNDIDAMHLTLKKNIKIWVRGYKRGIWILRSEF